MRSDLKANFLGQGGKLACQQRAETKRGADVRDAGLPISDVQPKLFEWIGRLPLEVRDPRPDFFAIPDHQRSYQIGLAREMMVDACLADSNHTRNIGVTEAVVSSGDDQ